MLYTLRKSLYEKRRKISPLSLIFNIILVILLLFIVFEIFFTMNFTSIYVEGPSMLPTLNGAAKTVGETQPGGDYIFVDVHASPDYGDIVVVRAWNAGDGEHNIIKRVVAFGGDTVKIERGVLFLKKEGEEEFTEVPSTWQILSQRVLLSCAET